jgi:signal transduction histidine kinase
MNTLVYAAVAVLSLALPLRAWLQDRRSRLRQAFALLGLDLALVYGAFALFLTTGRLGFDLAYGIASAFLPAAAYGFLSALLRRPGVAGGLQGRLAWAGLALGCAFAVAQLGLYTDQPNGSPAAILLGLWVFSGLGLNLLLVAEALQHAGQRITRARVRYLLGLMGAAVGFSAIEVLARTWRGLPGPGSLDLLSAPVLLQGVLPPVGVLLTGVLVYFMHQVLVLFRLLDLHEIFSRTLALALCAAILVVVQGVGVVWAGDMSHSPLQGAWLMLVATVLFLALYDPLRRAVERRLSAVLNRRAHLLARALEEVDQALPKALGLGTAFAAVLQPLVESGRVPSASVYLWDQERGQFVRAAARGTAEQDLLEALPPLSLDEPTGGIPPWLVRGELTRRARRPVPGAEAAGQRARMMKAIGAEVLLPLTSGQLLLGWLGLVDEPDGEGFSREDLQRLRRTTDLLAVVLENVHGFRQLEEQHRLATLGTMAAGLAHEIRNPLAAIKGAAQYLGDPGGEGLGGSGEAPEFVRIIVEEADRLSDVVDRFLDYARPLEVQATAVDLNALARRALESLRRQGLPAGIEVDLDLTEPLPQPAGDPTLLLQVLENLLTNAVQALDQRRPGDGGGHIRMHTRSGHAFGHGQGPTAVDLIVEDDGPGFPAQDRDKLFVPFFTRRPRGTGLGLALCRRIIHAHGGEIDAAARPGGGARFTVHLPLEPSARATPHPDPGGTL